MIELCGHQKQDDFGRYDAFCALDGEHILSQPHEYITGPEFEALIKKQAIEANKNEPVNHPNHYGGDTTYEVIKVAEAWGFEKDAYRFDALKYIARAGKKNPAKFAEDLDKAIFYLKRRRDNWLKEQNND